MKLESIGIASSLLCRCECGHSASIQANLKAGSDAKVEAVRGGKPYSRMVNATDYELNNRLALGLQLAGSGRTEAEIIPGLLNLSNGFMTRRYTSMQDELGLEIIGLSGEIPEENLWIEMHATDILINGPKGLSVSSDARWDKRGSGCRYDSLSGRFVMIGNRSKLIIAIYPMSQTCRKCQLNLPHADNLCPKNYEGSSKGMESTGAAIVVASV
jgi:hypothetical protein